MGKSERNSTDLILDSRIPSRHQRNNLAAWSAISAKYGEGGKGSGKFYSPNNILFNYLEKRAKGDGLTQRGLMPSSRGWGSHVVTYWELPGEWSPPTPLDEDISFIEGGTVFRQHLARERKGSWRQKILSQRQKVGLQCDGCDMARPDLAPQIQESVFEVHHLLPLNEGERKTQLGDLALLCACCHRVVHKMMRLENRNIAIDDLRKIMAPPKA